MTGVLLVVCVFGLIPSVDLDAAYKNAERAVGDIQQVSEQIKVYLEPRPIVARRHYIQTGNLRHFEVQYLSGSEFVGFVPLLNEGVDGNHYHSAM